MKRKAWLFSLLPLMALALMTGAVFRPLGAQAANVKANQPHTLGVKSQRASQHPRQANLTYHGGPVVGGTMVAYAIFWQPTGKSVPPGYNNLILRYFADIGGSKLSHNDTQYKSSNGQFPSNATLGGSWVDRQGYGGKFLIDTQIQAEVTHAQKVNGWTSTLKHAFFVFTVKGEIICFDASHRQCSNNVFCAYHSNFGNTLYASMPDVGVCGTPTSPNHDPEGDSTVDSTSHEQNEIATDPQGTAWFDSSGAEIGDKCSTSYGPLNPDGSNIVINGNPYIVQEEWDNAKHHCEIAGP